VPEPRRQGEQGGAERAHRHRGGQVGGGQSGQPVQPASPAGQQAERQPGHAQPRRPGRQGARWHRRHQDEPGRLAGLRAAVEHRAVGVDPGPQFGHAGRRCPGWDSDEFSGSNLFGHVLVGLGVGEPEAGPAGHGQERVDLAAVHPTQQIDVVDTQPVVQAADPRGGAFGRRAGAEGDGAHVLGGPEQPPPRIGPETRVPRHPGHRSGVQRLEVERAYPAYPQDRVGVDPPGHTVRAEEPLLLRTGHHGRE
jgi:hypothetical protein